RPARAPRAVPVLEPLSRAAPRRRPRRAPRPLVRSEVVVVRAVVVGATGYTGAELVRLLLGHPGVELAGIVGHSTAGEPVSSVIPSLAGIVAGTVAPFDARAIAEKADAAFCALPHGASAQKVRALREAGLVVFDLSADFRLRSLDTYRQWYGAHGAPVRPAQRVHGPPG